jgi:Uma2 family endonuclease
MYSAKARKLQIYEYKAGNYQYLLIKQYDQHPAAALEMNI